MTLGLALAADSLILLLAIAVWILAGRLRRLAERVARLEGSDELRSLPTRREGET